MAQAVLYVELVPTTTGIKKNVEKELNGTFDVADKKGTSVFSKIGGLAKGAAIAAGAAAAALTGIAIKGGFERMLKIEDAQAKLNGLGHDTKAVETIMTSALAAVKGTAFGLDSAATIAASAVASGIKPGKELENYLRLTADAATIAGISLDEMGSILNKVNANGKAMTENLNQLQDRGIPILQYLAEDYGVTTEAMSKMVSQGKVDAATFNRVLQENLGGAALKSGDTTRGAFANMLAALSRVGVGLIEGVFPYFKDTFNGITGLLDGLTDRLGPFSDAMSAAFSVITTGDFSAAIGEVLGVEEDSPLVDTLYTIRDVVGEISGAFTAMFAAFQAGTGDITSSGFAGFMEGLGNAARTLWDAFGPLVTQIIDLWASFSPLMLIMEALGPVLGEVANMVAGVLGQALTTIMPFIIQLVTLFGSLLSQALPMLIPLISQLGAFVGELASALLPLVGTLLSALMPAFEALVPVILSIIEAVLPLVTVLLDLLMPIIDALVPVVSALFAAFAPLISALVEVLAPIITTIADILSAVLVPVFGIVVAIIEVLAGVITWLVQNIVVPYFQNILIPLIGLIGSTFEVVFGGLGDFLGGVFSGIEIGFKAFINFLIDAINGFIGGLNEVGNFISDITGGEIDITIGKLPRLANGALVEASFGGSAAIIGEGRYDEAVLPLGGPQLEKIRDAIGGTGSSGTPDVTQYITVRDEDPRLFGRLMGREFTREMAGN